MTASESPGGSGLPEVPAELPVLDNGSGLSRESRISAQALARLLQTAFVSPSMPELMSSLPVARTCSR